MTEHVYPGRGGLRRAGRGQRQPARAAAGHARPAGDRPRAGPVEPLHDARRPRRRADQSRVRPARRARRPVDHRQRGDQLLRARHRQHGDPRDVRHRRAEGRVAQAAAGVPDPLGVRHDRARRRELRRHQHHLDDPPRRRRVRPQRPQVVRLGRPRPRLQARDLHGQVRRRRSVVPAAEHGARAARHPRHRGPARPADVRLPRPARPRRGAVHRRTRAGRPTCSARRATASRSPRAGSGPAACTTRCGPSGSPSALCS